MAKTKIDIISGQETFKNLQTFNSIDQLNETVRAHKENHKDQLNKTDLALLDLLQRHSAKFFGLSFLTKNNIAKMLDCSRKTIIRKCQKFEELGIIKQYETKRKSDMRQTSNIVVILPVQKEDVSQEVGKVSHQKNNISLKQIHNNNHLNIQKPSNRKPYIKMVPKRLQHFQGFFGTKIKELYGRIWLSAKKLEIKVDKEIMQEIAHVAFSKLVEYVKQGRNLSFDDMQKIVYVIACNQLKEREETKGLVEHGQMVNQVLNVLKSRKQPIQPVQKVPSLSLFESILNS